MFFFHLDYRKLKVTDLAFALDGSRKLTEQEFSRLKSFVKTVIQDYEVSEAGTHVAVIEYSDAARVAISFKYTKDVDSFKQAIDRVRPSRGKMASVNEALKLAREELFSPIGGGRPGIAKVRFWFSDVLHKSPWIYKCIHIYRISSPRLPVHIRVLYSSRLSHPRTVLVNLMCCIKEKETRLYFNDESF